MEYLQLYSSTWALPVVDSAAAGLLSVGFGLLVAAKRVKPILISKNLASLEKFSTYLDVLLLLHRFSHLLLLIL